MPAPHAPWYVVRLGPDALWLCPTCHDALVLLELGDHVRFLIGLSPQGERHLGGVAFRLAIPPRGTVCRHCWQEVPAADG